VQCGQEGREKKPRDFRGTKGEDAEVCRSPAAGRLGKSSRKEGAATSKESPAGKRILWGEGRSGTKPGRTYRWPSRIEKEVRSLAKMERSVSGRQRLKRGNDTRGEKGKALILSQGGRALMNKPYSLA